MVVFVWMYEKSFTLNKMFFMKKLFYMKMVEGGTIIEHLNEFNKITSQLTSVGINFNDEIRALLTLSFLLKSWDGLVMALCNSSSLGTLKFNDVVSIILSEKIY